MANYNSVTEGVDIVKTAVDNFGRVAGVNETPIKYFLTYFDFADIRFNVNTLNPSPWCVLQKT